MADGLGTVFVGGGGGVVGAVDLDIIHIRHSYLESSTKQVVQEGNVEDKAKSTFNMASFTRSSPISPFRYKFSTRSLFVAPELRQAMSKLRLWGWMRGRRRKREVRNGRVKKVSSISRIMVRFNV